MKTFIKGLCGAVILLCSNAILAADVVPNEIQMPGTQPNEVQNFESPDKCDNCHAGYDVNPEIEPAIGWRGAAMGNAGRDPVFWATLAIAEQDFDGAGDLCIRCHSAGGWYGGRSTPTDGSGLQASDDNGIDCDTCHMSTNTDNSELLGVMNSPFIPNCEPDPNIPDKCTKTGDAQSGEGFYGSGILSVYGGSDKLGPYTDAEARHQWLPSQWHRSPDFCGTCHDVSNSAVGDLAGNHGTQSLLPDHTKVVSSHDDHTNCTGTQLSNGGCLGGDIEDKAAFNNPPYAYGIVERTFSEYKSSPLSSTLVSDFTSLPADLQVPGGSLEVTYQAALGAGTGGNYEDNSPRYFTCQSCHMRPYEAKGCNKNGAPVRKDMPQHDHTGGNYWFAAMTQYQDNAGTLRLGGGLTGNQLLAMDLGAERATKHLREAANLEVNGNSVKITNLTGHKLISGYPEGRRMWLQIDWRDADDKVIRVDGEYGELTVDLDADGQVDDTVETILDLDGTNTRIYEAHYAITKEWATTVEALHGPDFALSYDRITGQPDCTVGQFLADASSDCSGPYHNTFHFALNNYVSHDNRIPPYQMSYDEAQKRNALPNPTNQYGNPGAGGVYEHWDEITLNPPTNADHATIQLLYQGTSWEYMQFLQKANDGQNAFLGNQGDAMMHAWLNADVVKNTGAPITGVMQVGSDYKMVPPAVMATANWGNASGGNNAPVANNEAYSTYTDTELSVPAPGVLGNDSDPDNNDTIEAVPYSGISQANGSVELLADGSFTYTPPAGFTGIDSFIYQAVDSDEAPSNEATVSIDVNAPPSCGAIGDKGVCNGTPGCLWSGSPRSGTCESSVCIPTDPPNEVCTDGVDNNCDGLTDCGDTVACGGDPACQQVDCSQFGDKTSCNAEATCRWHNKNKVCVAN